MFGLITFWNDLKSWRSFTSDLSIEEKNLIEFAQQPFTIYEKPVFDPAKLTKVKFNSIVIVSLDSLYKKTA